MRTALPRLAALGALLALSAPFARAENGAESAWVRAVYLEFYAGDLASAVASYETLAADHPGHERAPEALLRSALCREKFGDLDGAIRLARRAKTEYPQAASTLSRAETALKRLEGRAAWNRVNESLGQENEDLRLQIASLRGQLDRLRDTVQEGARDEAARRREIEDLKGRIGSLQKEKERLQEKLESHTAGGKEEEELTPEEILRREEADRERREKFRRLMAENYFQTGLALMKDEKFEEARKNFRRALQLDEQHPRAQDYLIRVGALLGDPESMQKEVLRRLEIKKEVRILEKKQELARAFRNAFAFYRRDAYPEAQRLFRKALDILVRDLPPGPEFDRQKDLATRYIRLCQQEEASSREGAPESGRSAEVRIRAFLLPPGTLRRLAEPRRIAFQGGSGTFLPAAPLSGKKAKAVAGDLAREGAVRMDEKRLLVPGDEERLERASGSGEDGQGAGFTLVLRPDPGAGALRLRVALTVRLASGEAMDLPGDGGPVRVPRRLSQALEGEIEIPAGGATLLAGCANPFPDRPGDDLVILVEVVG